jgi:hypothetical protein
MSDIKREGCDEVVESLDELYPDGVSASLVRDIYKQDAHKSEGGGLGATVYDESGDKKNDIEYLRVPGMGSIEAYELDDGSWAITRRDNLNHNKEDKL